MGLEYVGGGGGRLEGQGAGAEKTTALGHLEEDNSTCLALCFQKGELPPTLFTQELAEPDHESSGLEAWLGSQPHCSEVVLKIPDSGAGRQAFWPLLKAQRISGPCHTPASLPCQLFSQHLASWTGGGRCLGQSLWLQTPTQTQEGGR